MAVSWKTIIGMLPQIAMGFLPGFAGASRVGKLGKVALPIRMKEGTGAAFDYPKLTKPFRYQVARDVSTTSVDGKTAILPSLNKQINRADADAALVQDLAEHNRAIEGGYEKTLSKWWPGVDVKPRRHINPSSSAVEDIIINDDGTVQIKWYKGSKYYIYKAGKDARDSSQMAYELLSSPSIGRALPRNGHLEHADSKDLTGKPVSNKNVGWWGRKYYNPNWSSYKQYGG